MSGQLPLPGAEPPPIARFAGDHGFLSNFARAVVMLDGVAYPTVEHAFQAAKTLNPAERQRVLWKAPPAPDRPGVPRTAQEAKVEGRRLALRPDWEAAKVNVMRELLRQKFAEPALRGKLLATGSAALVEGNWWGDRFWGVCDGVGENWLGRLLMEVRAECQAQERARQLAPTAPAAPDTLLDVTVDEYRVVQTRAGTHAYRHGERWRDCTGDNLVLALACRVEELEKRLRAAGGAK